MFNKLYVQIKTIFKENYKFLFGLFILFFIMTFELPYYIETPGGLIDVSKRIDISDSYNLEGSFNLAYVSEFKATIPTILWGLIDDDWDILKKEEVISTNETEEINDYRNHLMLEEANQNAIYVGFKKANEKVMIKNEKVYVIFIGEDSDTDLKIGDQIIEVNNIKINNKEDVTNILNKYDVNDEIKFKVINDEKEYTRVGTLFEINERNVIGIVISEIKEIETDRDISFSFKSSESGPSGGFMMALSIYNYLTFEDISNGLRIVGTGTIDELGNVGTIGGIEYKIKGAVKKDADIFFVPSGENYEEAKKIVEEEELDIELIEVENIDDAIEYLDNL